MAWILLLLILLFLVWSFWIEPRWLRIRSYEVAIDGLTKPLTAVVVSDLQPNTLHWDTDRLRRAFRRVQGFEPHVVFWLGDYYNAPMGRTKRFLDRFPRLKRRVLRHLPVMEEIAYEMSSIKAPMGQVAVLGAHDWAWSGDRVREELEDVGITVLEDELVVLRDPESGQALQVIGYNDISSGREPDFDRLHAMVDPVLPQVALTHSPDAFPAARGGPKLVLAGQSHGGQVNLPFIGPLRLPMQHKAFDKGWFSDGRRRLFVTSGIGTSFPPMRFRVRPEIIVLDLVPPY
ncbi:metallophosphoesterase [Oceanomicrobium pacificus]|uniref:Calcineurin-like phosphoesterase domain-containing protein n=1 Tax=Oceanomicrobium pacificus TaxID=2692916 RepID=A0A6B0TXX1_9RHOB|nr:hypothetical protein [Oceanomicrobium pacificus]MXU66298.1 hypothetical protein [Oceanomicrobium pacificus]